MEELQPAPVEAVRTWDRPAVVIPVFVLVAAVGGLFESFTQSANLLVLVVGGTMFWLGLSGRVNRRPPVTQLPPGAVWWLVPVLMLAGVELFAFGKASIEDYPTLSLLADPVLEGYLPRAAAYLGWLIGFWGLLRR